MSSTTIPVARPAVTEPEKIGLGRGIGALLGVLAIPAIWFAPFALEARAKHALAVGAFMVIFWVAEVIPVAMTGLVGCWLFWALKVVPADVAFRGFSNENPWFLLGAIFIGAMVTESGLDRRLSYRILSWCGTTYSQILLGFILVGFVMAFMIPAGPPRVILLGSIALGVVSSFGLDHKSNVAKSIILAITFCATLFDKSIIASTPSILARTMIERFGHVPVYWSQWFIAYLPLDIINIMAAWWLMKRLYKPEVNELPGGKAFLQQQLRSLGPWSTNEKKAAFWTMLAITLWATDFLHKINPAVIGLGIGLAATLPFIGFLDVRDARKLNFFIVIFMGANISMAEAMRDAKALDVVADSLFRFLGPYIHNVLHSTVILYWAAFVAHLVLASETSMIAISMPLVMNFAVKNHLNPLALGMVWSFATGGKLFIYQSLV
jgi:sodium-dependent dicarboxylate transporter 2/3/5